MTSGPQYQIDCPDSPPGPCGEIATPINAILDWPMATDFGYQVWSNQLVNQQMKKILDFWGEFLASSESRRVLNSSVPLFPGGPTTFAWLSDPARQEMVNVTCSAAPDQTTCKQYPFEHFFICDPSKVCVVFDVIQAMKKNTQVEITSPK